MLESQREVVLKLMQDERDILKRNADLVAEIKQIPHLNIDLNFDLAELREEALQISEWSSHELHPNKNLPQWYYDHHRRSFRGQCLVDYTPHGTHGMKDVEGYLFQEPDAQFDELGRLKFFPTPWGERMPKTLQALRKISPYLNRTRVVRTPPGGGIHWHSHHNNVYKNEYLRLAVVSLTLDTNGEAYHGVRDYRDANANSVQSHYEAGQAVLFNAWHDHEFWNRGTTDRLAIISYFNFPDQQLLDSLRKPVESYRGPRIAPG